MKEEVFGIYTEQITVNKENDFFTFQKMNSYGKEQNVTKGKTWKWDEGMAHADIEGRLSRVTVLVSMAICLS